MSNDSHWINDSRGRRKTGTMGTLASQTVETEIGVWVQASGALLRMSGPPGVSPPEKIFRLHMTYPAIQCILAIKWFHYAFLNTLRMETAITRVPPLNDRWTTVMLAAVARQIYRSSLKCRHLGSFVKSKPAGLTTHHDTCSDVIISTGRL